MTVKEGIISLTVTFEKELASLCFQVIYGLSPWGYLKRNSWEFMCQGQSKEHLVAVLKMLFFSNVIKEEM